MRWGSLSDKEVERRRNESLEALERLGKERFERWYQARCDADYWRFGKRCSGCDYWVSEQGYLGQCQQAGKLSGLDVLKSCGFEHYTGPIPAPDYPFTRAWGACVNFKDDFDWSSLPQEYLVEIGAVRNGVLRDKPKHYDQVSS